MIWVVGTGRCGMHHYTSHVNGYIQSAKDWKGLSVKRYHNEDWNEPYVRDVIRYRMNLPYSCVTDCAQFMFMDLIKEIDNDAHFIWLVRDKKSVVDGFMQKPGEDNRIHPRGWDFSYKNKRALLEWYYDEVNSIIEKNLNGASYEMVPYESIPKSTEEEISKLRVFA